MTHSNETITAKIRKLLELSRRGQENERQVAAERLSFLLKKHNISLDDIDPENKSQHAFRYKTKFEKDLIFQVAYLVTGEKASDYWKTLNKNEVSLELTKAHAVEIERLYSFWRVALKGELERCFSAFIQVNRIFGESDGSNDRELTPKEMAEIKRMAMMMQGMSASRPFHQLEAS